MFNNKNRLAVAIAAACSLNVAFAAEQDPLELDGQTVVGETQQADADSYQSTASSAATKLTLTPRQTPQSISTLTRAQLDDFGLDSVNDALKMATGIQVQEVETDRTYYTARGFDITNFQYDGIGIPFVYGNVQGDLDTAMYERVEVIRGANGLMSGTGNPSATINFVRKRPTATPQARIDLTAGSWDKRRVDVDVSGALTAAGTLRGRAVYAHENKNAYLDLYGREKNIFHGVLEADLGDATLFTVGHTLQKSDANSPMWGALPLTFSDGSPTDYSRSTSTSADWAYWNVQENRTFAELAHDLGNGWQAKAVLTHVKKEGDGSLFYVYGTPNRSTGLGLFSYPSEYRDENRQLIADLQLNGSFDLAGRMHDAVLGASWSRSELEDISWYDSRARDMNGTPQLTPLPMPLEQWNGNIAEPLNDAGTNGSDFTDRMQSYYGAARWSLTDRLSLITGARVVDVESRGGNYGSDKTTKYTGELVPYAGLVYDLTEQYSVYASYTEIFDPQTEVDGTGSRLAPVEGVNYEAGIKGELFDDRVNLSLAVFRTEQDNVAEMAGMIAGRSYYRGVEGLTSEGYEIEVSGELLPGWQATAGYTFVDIVDATGKHAVTYSPKHQAKAATTYRIPGLEQLKVGASLNWQDKVYNGAAEQDAYAVVNLMARYDIDAQWSVSANLNNLTDEKYLSSLYWSQAYYAAPRNASMTVSWTY